MNDHAIAGPGWSRIAPTLIILLLAGLLVFYHVTMLVDLAQGKGLSSDAGFNAIQAILRFAIIVSLGAVVLGKRVALLAMWFSIGGLVATHYWAHFGNLPVDFTAGRHPLSYLKGFIFPTIITTAFLYRRRQGGPGFL
ncbi:hypothetical protein [Erythrobacter mangrovi]|uniref:DoxX family protein n=1 Tax=Erythrobacter mangrovi TaxID=2739433 RepID=A0A7D4BF27_9SPHN|nr:hypothetical protein [Erythrobacter mangrovi]QKG70322.1 hypothetical protein HQR01_02465 [Erythrobacter mangrovi]